MRSHDPWEVAYSSRAHRDLRALDRLVATGIFTAIEHLADRGQGDVRRLRGYEREWRLRVGDWRVRLTMDAQTRTIQVLRILHRREPYRG